MNDIQLNLQVIERHGYAFIALSDCVLWDQVLTRSAGRTNSLTDKHCEWIN